MIPRTHTASKCPGWNPHLGQNHQLSLCLEMGHNSKRAFRGGVIVQPVYGRGDGQRATGRAQRLGSAQRVMVWVMS